jgi:hypothetical protein
LNLSKIVFTRHVLYPQVDNKAQPVVAKVNKPPQTFVSLGPQHIAAAGLIPQSIQVSVDPLLTTGAKAFEIQIPGHIHAVTSRPNSDTRALVVAMHVLNACYFACVC